MTTDTNQLTAVILGKIRDVFGSLFETQVKPVLLTPNSGEIPETLRLNAGDLVNQEWRVPAQIIGIRCGCLPHPVSGIIFSSAKEVETFFASNPALANTLVTSWPGNPHSFLIIWLRVSDGIKTTRKFNSIVLVGEGVLPITTTEKEFRKFIVTSGTIAEVSFALIKWPADVAGAVLVLILEQRFGHPYTVLGKKKIILNTTFWAYFLGRKLNLEYHVQQKQFFLNNGKLIRCSSENVITFILDLLRQSARNDKSFPPLEIRLKVAQEILAEMKIAMAVHTPGEKESLIKFLTESIVRQPGESVTVAELFNAYSHTCSGWNVTGYPLVVFQRVLPEHVRKTFGLLKSHDLRRKVDGGIVEWRRGFRGLTFRREASEASGLDVPDGSFQKKSDATDATDIPDATLRRGERPCELNLAETPKT